MPPPWSEELLIVKKTIVIHLYVFTVFIIFVEIDKNNITLYQCDFLRSSSGCHLTVFQFQYYMV